ncbi:hypothetical protein BKA64DRAFT_668567 [Cadophora sp. MPI-SDFR-AT-0126]|nr:hypothetical protein BKA64DRAFT_668567 [Leotiomycetes sp. MPI-SDFR-AT-0126]
MASDCELCLRETRGFISSRRQFGHSSVEMLRLSFPASIQGLFVLLLPFLVHDCDFQAGTETPSRITSLGVFAVCVLRMDPLWKLWLQSSCIWCLIALELELPLPSSRAKWWLLTSEDVCTPKPPITASPSPDCSKHLFIRLTWLAQQSKCHHFGKAIRYIE